MRRMFKDPTKRSQIVISLFIAGVLLIVLTSAVLVFETFGRTLIQFDIHQNEELIYLSDFSEPPQFAIWMQNTKTNKLKTVFVTSRVSKGDWEGKANVPVALPRWFDLFKGENRAYDHVDNDEFSAVTGATPRADYFSIRVEVPPGSSWICWIEMNLAGDFNDDYPEFDIETLREDEFSCGQPALLFKAEIVAEAGRKAVPVLDSQSVWDNGVNIVEPVGEGVTTARNVFDDMLITVIRPKPKLIDKTKIFYY
jgi:hypothetical protein